MVSSPLLAQEETSETSKGITPTADTFLRKGKKDNYGGKEQMEIGTNASKNTDFVGLVKFELDGIAPSNVTKATLRIVSERVKGNPVISIYQYAADWEENATYEAQAANIEAARAASAIATFNPKGTKGRSIVYDAQSNVSTDINDWTNEIDLTEYVKGLASTTVSLMLAETNNQPDNQKYFAREAKDFNPKKDASITIKAADITPLLTVEYTTATGIDGIKNNVVKASKIYTLQGIEVKSMAKPGIYIVGGKKVVKK